MASRKERNALRRRDLLARLRAVFFSVWRARLSAEKWFAILLCNPQLENLDVSRMFNSTGWRAARQIGAPRPEVGRKHKLGTFTFFSRAAGRVDISSSYEVNSSASHTLRLF